jgi:hypothetical protein
MFGSSFKENLIGTVLIIFGCLIVTVIVVVVGRIRENQKQEFSLGIGTTDCETDIFLADSTGSWGENTSIETGDPVWFKTSTTYASKLLDPPQGLTHRFTPSFDTVRYVDEKTKVDTRAPKTVVNAELCFTASSAVQPGEYMVDMEMTFINPQDSYFPPTVVTKTFTINVTDEN